MCADANYSGETWRQCRSYVCVDNQTAIEDSERNAAATRLDAALADADAILDGEPDATSN